MSSDKEIWDDFREGKSYALSHIYYKNIQILYSYGKKISDDDNLIKDTIQDLFFDLIRTRNNLGETDNIKFYLMCAFKRKLISNFKKNNSRLLFDEKMEWLSTRIDSVENDIVEKENQLQNEELIKKALGELSPKQREILYYRYTCEFEYEEICKIMSIKYDSARKQVFRAIKVLKEILSQSNTVTLFLLFTVRI